MEKWAESLCLGTDPTCRFFWSLEKEPGTVENQDPSGALGGLFCIFTLIGRVWSNTFTKNQKALLDSVFKISTFIYWIIKIKIQTQMSLIRDFFGKWCLLRCSWPYRSSWMYFRVIRSSKILKCALETLWLESISLVDDKSKMDQLINII